MSKKYHRPSPVPDGNQPHSGPSYPSPADERISGSVPGTGFQEEDPKGRLGDFTVTGEHVRQQPGPRNDGGKRHGEDAPM